MATYTTTSVNWQDGDYDTEATSPREAAIIHATEGWSNAEDELELEAPVEIRVTGPDGKVSEWLVTPPGDSPIAVLLHRALGAKPTAATRIRMSLQVKADDTIVTEMRTVEGWIKLTQAEIDEMLWSEVEDALEAACGRWMGERIEYGWGPA